MSLVKALDTHGIVSVGRDSLPTTSNLKVRILQRPQSCPKKPPCRVKTLRQIMQRCLQVPYLPQLICSHAVHSEGRCIMTCDDLMTSRPLVVRYKEHYRSAANPTALSYKNMTFSRHYIECHPAQEPKLTVKILKKTSGSLDRKITEGLFI